MNTPPIIVVGTGRSGTSVVAGMLWNMGIFMGNSLVPADKNNPAGHFEDEKFKELNLDYLSKKFDEEEFRKRVRRILNFRGTTHEWWGWKDPSTAQFLKYYIEPYEKPKVIFCKRDKKDVKNSMKKCYGWTDDQCDRLIEARLKGIEEVKDKVDLLELKFEDIVKNPEKIVDKLYKFTGVPEVDYRRFRAIDLVKPRKYGEKKILIATPNMGWIRREVTSLHITMSHDTRYDREFRFPRGVPYELNINKLIYEDFLPGDFDYLLLVDSDNPALKNPLDLVELDKDVIACPTPQWYNDSVDYVIEDEVNHYVGNGVNRNLCKPVPESRRQGLQEVDSVGSGCILIARRVLENVEDAFNPVWHEPTKRQTGDFSFCHKAREKGFHIWAHWDYTCDHIKEVSLNRVKSFK